MKKHITFIIALFMAITCFGQVNNIVYTAGVAYTDGPPTFNPGGKGSKIAVDIVTRKIYTHTVGSTWALYGNTLQTIIGCVSPAYIPAGFQSDFVINGCDSLYYYHSGAWWHLNKGGGSTYTAGTGISISGSNVISNTGDLSTTNELQTLSYSAPTLSLSNGGGSVNLSGLSDNLGNHTATTNLNMSGFNISNPNILSRVANYTSSIKFEAPSGLLRFNTFNTSLPNFHSSLDMGAGQMSFASFDDASGQSTGMDVNYNGFFGTLYGTDTEGGFGISVDGFNTSVLNTTTGNSGAMIVKPEVGVTLTWGTPLGESSFKTKDDAADDPGIIIRTSDVATGKVKTLKMLGDTALIGVGERYDTYLGVGAEYITIGSINPVNAVKYGASAKNYMFYTEDKSADIAADDRGIPDVGTLKSGLVPVTPRQVSDASALNNETFYSTTRSKLCYKDPGGTIHDLY